MGWRERNSFALTKSEIISETFSSMQRTHGEGRFGRRLRGRKYVNFVPSNLNTLLLAYKSVFAETDVWITGESLQLMETKIWGTEGWW